MAIALASIAAFRSSAFLIPVSISLADTCGSQTFHRLRQSGIDEELFDVISGFEALSE